MVNANIVISVSAILVAVILTIVFVMRKAGDPTNNYSVSVTGSVSGSNAAMYFCIGDDCQFHGLLPEKAPDFPGYFALVGFSMDGSDYITEHSIGKTFIFTGDALTDCIDSEKIDGALLDSRVAQMKAAFKGSNEFEVESCTQASADADRVCTTDTFTMATYALNTNPSSDSPSVLNRVVPSIDECRAVWNHNSANGADFPDLREPQGAVTGIEVVPADLSAVRRLNEGGEEVRMLWNRDVYNGQGQRWYMDTAASAYDRSGKHNQVIWVDCVTNTPFGGSAVARFIYDWSGNTMVIAFAGSNDVWDFVLDLVQWGHPNLHYGFYHYVELLQGCVNYYNDMLWAWGIDVDAYTGHSLGGAAAVVYKHLWWNRNGGSHAQVFTWGAPKTTRYNSCGKPGQRNFNEKDPVASNGMGLMGSFNHDVSSALRLYEGSYCNNWWWGSCFGWGTSYNVQWVGCGDNAGGCGWFFDCLWHVGRHSMSQYANYNH